MERNDVRTVEVSLLERETQTVAWQHALVGLSSRFLKSMQCLALAPECSHVTMLPASSLPQPLLSYPSSLHPFPHRFTYLVSRAQTQTWRRKHGGADFSQQD